VQPVGFQKEKDLKYWVKICVEFNEKARSSKRKK